MHILLSGAVFVSDSTLCVMLYKFIIVYLVKSGSYSID